MNKIDTASVKSAPPSSAARLPTDECQDAEIVADVEGIWKRMRQEAGDAIQGEPVLKQFITETVLDHPTLTEAIIFRIAQRLRHADLTRDIIIETFNEVAGRDANLLPLFAKDLQAVFDRDPACQRYLEPMLYFKGFHALATHRFAHAVWQSGRKDFAFYLQSQSSKIFAADIHPAARFGSGIMLDHATGLVVGETAVVGDNCSILHAVTLGGSGKATGDRHPKIGAGVMIGAGAKVLGNIHVGNCCLIASGSVVLNDVPPQKTVAGVPAKIVGSIGTQEPATTMDQRIGPDDYSLL
ncbi:MAG: serine O-acetyltransferase [Alphaproteobacteria bacterium]|nr:serine O-acetyltransferase [Alphaproteobacteria bacterium]